MTREPITLSGFATHRDECLLNGITYLGRKKSFSLIPIRQVAIAIMKINTPKKTCTFRYIERRPSGSLGNRKLTKPNKSWEKKETKFINEQVKICFNLEDSLT